MSTLLRLCTAGSVDDGKSTLIGRLLYEARAVYEDQLSSVKAASRNRGAGPIDFSLFTDGLKAEREQGITIDVAYRYFATARRKFILADTPGHEQYTRNMATGASTADLAILLVDARYGVREQTRRHARIARLLGISHLVLAVNKMDLVGFDRRVFDDIHAEFATFADGAETHAIPLSALNGDNVIERERRDAVVHRTAAARVSRDREHRQVGHRQRLQVPGAAGGASQPRVPRLRRADRLGHDSPGRPDHGVAFRAPDTHQPHRHLGRRPGGGARTDVGDVDAGRRGRRQPRRRDLDDAAARDPAAVRQRGVDGRTAARAGPGLPAEARGANRDRGARQPPDDERDRAGDGDRGAAAAVRSVRTPTARPAASSSSIRRPMRRPGPA